MPRGGCPLTAKQSTQPGHIFYTPKYLLTLLTFECDLGSNKAAFDEWLKFALFLAQHLLL